MNSDRDDAALVRDSFGELFDRHAVSIHRYLASRVGAAQADDLLGNTFLIAYERRSHYDNDRADARPWLFGIATNLLRRHRRDEIRLYRALARSGAEPPLIECDVDRVIDRVDAGAWSPQLAVALAALKDADREVLLLFAACELSYAEIAAALDLRVGTVASRLNRARRQVRMSLGLPVKTVAVNDVKPAIPATPPIGVTPWMK